MRTAILCMMGALALAPAAFAQTDDGSRLEFDARLVRGERAAGAVFLSAKQQRELPGLVPMRRSFRSRIVDPLLWERAPAQPAPEEESTE